MSIPVTQPLNSLVTEPLAGHSHQGNALDTAVEEISAALTQIEVILSDNDSDNAEEIPLNLSNTTSQTPGAAFTDLPSEILLIIFGYACLTGERWEALSLSLVCACWRALMLADPNLWSNIALAVRDRDPRSTPSLSTSSLIRMARLTQLYLQRSEDCLLSVTIKIPTRFKSLNTNTPWQSYISIAALSYLQEASARISHLHLRVDHNLLHDFAYVSPCPLAIDSRHNHPCSETIPLPHLTSLTVDYISRNCFYFPFQNLSRLTHLSLGHEGLYFFQKSAASQAQPVPDLKFPRLTTYTIFDSSSFYQLCRTMTLTNASPRIRQVVLANMPSLADLTISNHASAQALFPEVSALKIINSPDTFTATFCRVFQFPALKSFELEYNPSLGNAPNSTRPRDLPIPWTELACDIIYFIRRCPMIQTVILRNAHDSCYPRSELVQEITFESGINPEVHIVGFPMHSDEHNAAALLSASAMMEYLRGFETEPA
ncbi:hypothetical protein GYMLUDRAFT_36027 [Collybiopsis luxurians FD-317 M1]|nr:hypothetical protein GYMLUDRAFT_36027 [Collybiopsis luxurians FD-317 M1]